MERMPLTGRDHGEEGQITSVPDLAAALDQVLDRAARGGRTKSRMQKDSGISPSTFYAALSGHTLPRADTLDAILDAAKVPADEAERLAAARNRLDRQRRTRPAEPAKLAPSAVPAAISPAPVAGDAAAAALTTGGGELKRGLRRHRRRLVVAAVIGVVVVAAAIIAIVIAVHTSSGSFPRLQAHPDPRHRTWSTAQVACTAQQTWTYRFDDHYRGEVYVQLTPTGLTPLTVDVTLTWGDLHWPGRAVVIHPGVLGQRQGGTLLRFVKKESVDSDPTDWNPGVQLTSTAPLCAVFGTASTRPIPAPTSLVETPGWVAN